MTRGCISNLFVDFILIFCTYNIMRVKLYNKLYNFITLCTDVNTYKNSYAEYLRGIRDYIFNLAN